MDSVELVPIMKMSGTGNDFLMVNNISLQYADHTLSSLAKEACPRRTSAGADGMIFIEPATLSGHDYRMRIINTDGSEACAKIYYIDTGVPHAIVFLDDVASVDVATLGRAIRHHDAFKPRGTNANFVQLLGNNTIKVRTYERGVEGETYACGTGSTACAIVAGLISNYTSPVKVMTSGGAILTIYFELDLVNKVVIGSPFLEGGVDIIYKGEYYWRGCKK